MAPADASTGRQLKRITDGSSLAAGAAAAFFVVALITTAIYPVKTIAPPISVGVLYLLGVLLTASIWGLRLGAVTAILSALAFNFFHIPPTGELTIAKEDDGVAFVTFLVVAFAVSWIADRARRRTLEAEERRREADLSAETARLLLGGASVTAALPMVTRRISTVLELPSAAIELTAAESDDRRIAIPLSDSGEPIGALIVPRSITARTDRRLRERVVPSLQTLLAAALRRERLQSEVIESQAVRRSDEMKTALLRAISHDLRSPLTAIATAGEALGSSSLSDEDRTQLSRAVTDEAARLSTLVSQLLDLSRLEAGAAEPRRDWCSVEELLREVVEQNGVEPGKVIVNVDGALPFVRADAAQLERAFANLLANSLRHSGEQPVAIRAGRLGGHIVVSVSNQGPGIPAAEIESIFEPFYRGDQRTSHSGSGLGLAIVKGFVEANGGVVRAESLPGQGATFIVELPLEPAEAADG